MVGAGIVGLMCALELQQRGARVRVLDAGQSRPSASWAGGGILSPLFPWRAPEALSALTRDARQHYRQWCQRARDEAGMEVELHECGMFVCQPDSAEPIRWARSQGVSLEAGSLSRHFPGWPVTDGIWMPEVGAIRNPQMLRALGELARRRGVIIDTGLVEQVKAASGQIVTRQGQQLQAGRLVLAAGQWNQALAAGLIDPDLLFPVRGQMLLYQLSPGQVPAILLSEQGYLIPRRDGLVLVGSTLEPGVSDSLPTEAGDLQLRALAQSLMPALAAHQPVAQWAGVRPGCARATPVIRALDDAQRTWLVGGHYRNGLVAAPATARLLAELLTGERPFIDPAPYR